MVDEKESVENDEAKVDDAPKEPARKAGRPAKRAATKPKSESDEPEDTATEDGEEKPAVTYEATAPEGRIVSEGEEVEVNTREENGAVIAAETVYRKKRLPNSQRYTYVLIASEGTQVQ